MSPAQHSPLLSRRNKGAALSPSYFLNKVGYMMKTVPRICAVGFAGLSTQSESVRAHRTAGEVSERGPDRPPAYRPSSFK